jgi:hypothetical protein
MGLSRREKEILAQIEDEFTPKEAGMAAALNAESVRRLQSTPAVRIWLRLLGLLMVRWPEPAADEATGAFRNGAGCWLSVE